MESSPLAGQQRSLEQFRHLLFHLQMECGSIHDFFRFFKEEIGLKHFDALKNLDPNLMPQLLAREYVLEARRASSFPQAKKHLETALLLDPHCAEACMELALISETPEAAMMWYHRSMEACETALGQEQFQSLLAAFREAPWKQVELHTWIKAKVNLAETLFRTGFYETAAGHFQTLLDMNPADDLQLQPYLLTCLLSDQRFIEAGALCKAYAYDGSAHWYYCKAFVRFQLEGHTRLSSRMLLRAFKRNLWVAAYLLGLEELPALKSVNPGKPAGLFQAPSSRSQPFREGSRAEAVECVKCIAPALYENQSLVNWIWDQLKAVAVA